MRKLLLITIALAVSGWSNLYAAAFCPHMGFAAATDKVKAATKPPGTPRSTPHCHSETVASDSPAPAADWNRPPKLGQIMGVGYPSFSSANRCGDCFMSGELTVRAAPASEGLGSRPDTSRTYTPIAGDFKHAVINSSPVHFRPGAPPGRRARTYLLISVFLI
jgi:hypothetical protein